MRVREIINERDTGNSIIVYHGSPHLFSAEDDAPHGRFQLDKLGSGEGAQVYGKGLYFAENPKVGQTYKNRLTKPKDYTVPMFLDGRPVTRRNWVDVERDMWAKGDDIGGMLAAILGDANRYNLRNLRQITNFYKPDARGHYVHYPPSSNDRLFKQAMQQLYRRVTMAPNRGVIYQVALHADPDRSFLNWNLPLNQQPQLQGLVAQYGRPGTFIDPNTWTTRHLSAPETGGDLYQILQTDYGDDEAAKIMGAAGLKGSKYLDAGSRPKGLGGYNYVVMDPAIIEILGKKVAR